MPDWCRCGGDVADDDCPKCGAQMCALCLEEHEPECVELEGWQLGDEDSDARGKAEGDA